jgi:hypothetical protein
MSKEDLSRLIAQSPGKPREVQECKPLSEVLPLMDGTQLMALNGALKKTLEATAQSSKYTNSFFDIVKELVAIGGENTTLGDELRYTHVAADLSVTPERIVDPRPSTVARYSLVEITEREAPEGGDKVREAIWVKGMSGLTPLELQQRAILAAHGAKKLGPSASLEEMIEAGKETNP